MDSSRGPWKADRAAGPTCEQACLAGKGSQRWEQIGVPQGSSANDGRSGCSPLLTDPVVPSGPAACEGSGSSSPAPPNSSSAFYGRWGRSILPNSEVREGRQRVCVVGIEQERRWDQELGPQAPRVISTAEVCGAPGEAVPEGRVPGECREGAGSTNLCRPPSAVSRGTGSERIW